MGSNLDESKSGRKKTNQSRNLGDYFFRFFRWILILGFFGFVLRGWYWSYDKYSSKQTSIGLIKNESSILRYPSVTFCPKFFKEVEITKHMLTRREYKSCVNRCETDRDSNLVCNCLQGSNKLCEDYEELCQGNDTSNFPEEQASWSLEDVNLSDRLDFWSYNRTDFLTTFSHPEFGDPRTATHVLYNDSYWTESVPHNKLSGKCFTYDPPFDSQPGWWHGIRVGLKYHGFPVKSDEDRQRKMQARMQIFVHEKGKFAFYLQDDYPSSVRLEFGEMEQMEENNIDFTYKTYTALDRPERPCSADPNYDFSKCATLKYSEERGCQLSWHHYNDSAIPVCQNVSALIDLFNMEADDVRNEDKAYLSPLQVAFKTGCPLPCTTTTIVPNYSSKKVNTKWHWLKELDNRAQWTLVLWFKNFQFLYEVEYVVCNWTCLIGEVGGNLGFFLGGSILAFIDIMLGPIKSLRLRKR